MKNGVRTERDNRKTATQPGAMPGGPLAENKKRQKQKDLIHTHHKKRGDQDESKRSI